MSRCTECRRKMDRIEAQTYEECRTCRKNGGYHRIPTMNRRMQSEESYRPITESEAVASVELGDRFSEDRDNGYAFFPEHGRTP